MAVSRVLEPAAARRTVTVGHELKVLLLEVHREAPLLLLLHRGHAGHMEHHIRELVLQRDTEDNYRQSITGAPPEYNYRQSTTIELRDNYQGITGV